MTRVGMRAAREQRARRNARLVGMAGFLVAAAMPPILWHRAIGMIASDFKMDATYLTGWVAYVLIGFGLLMFVPVIVSIGRHPESRLYPRARNAYLGWGISCYLLGIALATQVATITRGISGH